MPQASARSGHFLTIRGVKVWMEDTPLPTTQMELFGRSFERFRRLTLTPEPPPPRFAPAIDRPAAP
jgi:hypothetical protein